MGPRPFTLQQANNICKDFSHLIGKEFKQEQDVVIERIAVAPFDEDNKKVFIDNYAKFGSRKDELDGYVGHFYDVVIIARGNDSAEKKIEYDYIRNYARENHYSYVFPEYPFN